MLGNSDRRSHGFVNQLDLTMCERVDFVKIESIRIKNYKVLKDVKVENIQNLAVFLGMNGSGKTTFFDVFGFLNDALVTNVKAALAIRGGFKEVVSRGQTGDIEFEIKFRPSAKEPKVTYSLSIGLNENKDPIVRKETLRLRRGSTGSPWKMLDFSNGEGIAISGDYSSYEKLKGAKRESQKLDSPDILAIKGVGQFKEFVAVSKLRRLIEDWYVSDFHVEDTRGVKDAGYSEHLSKTGDNLALVAKYMYDNHKDKFNEILEKMRIRVPGVNTIEAEETNDGRIILKFQDGKFKDPFAARYVSDGTIKMFTYLLLLNDPNKHELLCVEEPENQLYPKLLAELAEEFRAYSSSTGQVFISTHSPDFLNAIKLDELYCIIKKDGYSQILKASNSERIRNLYNGGDLLGWLWNQELLLDEGDV